MQRKVLLVFCLAVATLSPGLYGKKKPKVIVAPPTPQMAPDQKILHALNRLTFGPRPGDIEEVKKQGLDRWIEAQLHPETIAENPVLEAKLAPLETLRMSTEDMLAKYPSQQMIKAMADGRQPLPSDPLSRAAVKTAIERYKDKKGIEAEPPAAIPAPQRRPPAELLAELQAMPPDQLLAALEAMPPTMRGRIAQIAPPELRRMAQVLNAPGQTVNRDLTEGKLLRAIYSNRQLDEVLTDFWYNHFNVYLDKGADKSLVTAYERDVIRPRVLGKFKDLLLATAQSPAMLFYLDNWQSSGPDMRPKAGKQRKQGLNENYGRELMELHTLGVDGGYTQQDVTEVARCFTGWTMRQPQRGSEFEFNPKMHDQGEKHVLGVIIPAGGGVEDGLKVLDILAKHPSTARFIATSLATRFVSDAPPETLVTRMANTFTTTDGDLREVMRTMLAAPEFGAPEAFRSKVKSPLEMVVSAVRAVGGDVDNPANMANLMNQLGEPLYRKQEPTGYSNRGADWMNSASLLARMNFASDLAQQKIRGVRVDAARFTGDPQQIERSLLLMPPSPDSIAAIQAGLDEQKQLTAAQTGPLVAGLTLGSPDFQRR
jgi:uncharacterized protein (DUF1800 family)